ncbi:MAG: hypothetical protein QM650_11700 [Microlunatus sp.]
MSGPDVQFIEIDPTSDEAVAAVSRYYDELAQRSQEGFDVEAYASGATPVDEPSRFVLATRDGVPVACGTLRSLTEAIALYDRSGYRRIPRYNDNPYAQLWFEKILVEEPESARQRTT